MIVFPLFVFVVPKHAVPSLLASSPLLTFLFAIQFLFLIHLPRPMLYWILQSMILTQANLKKGTKT